MIKQISKPYRNQNGQLVRKVEGVEIIQMEEKTEHEKILNEIINKARCER